MAATLSYRHVFGVKGNVRNALHYADKDVIVYPAGHNVIKHYTENSLQEFINGNDASQGITALATTQNKHLIAVAEQGEQASVTVYKLRTLFKQKTLSSSECRSKNIISMSFSTDDSLLVTLSGGPSWQLIAWVWEKARLIAHVQVSPAPDARLYGCAVNPVNPTKVAVHGDGLFRFYSLEEERFVPVPMSTSFNERQPQNYTSFAWLPEDTSIIGTSSGDLLLLHREVLVTVLDSSPSDGNSIDCIVPTARGFLIGGELGLVHEFERTDEHSGYYHRARTFQVPPGPGDTYLNILSMAVEPAEEGVICLLNNNQIKYLSLLTSSVKGGDSGTPSGAGTRRSSASTVPAGTVSETPDNASATDGARPEFVDIIQPVHGPRLGKLVSLQDAWVNAPITGMDVALRKPLVATCSVDHSVRVWNYLEKRLELCKTFTEEPLSVAMHPTGLHLIVGFPDKVRYMNVLMEDLRTFREFSVKGCRELKFSHGGHMFAAANSNMIQVFDSHTFEMKVSLRGHNGKVVSLWWTQDDSALLSAGLDGAVYQWNLVEGKREGEFVTKGTPYTSAHSNLDCSVAYASGGDSMLREIDMNASLVMKEVNAGCVLGQVVLSTSQNMLFAACSDTGRGVAMTGPTVDLAAAGKLVPGAAPGGGGGGGSGGVALQATTPIATALSATSPPPPGSIKAFVYPLTGDNFTYPAMSAPVTRLAMSYDDTLLFAAGADGVLMVFDVRDKDGRVPHRDGAVKMPWATEVLVTAADLDDRTATIQELQEETEELQSNNDYAMRMKDIAFGEQMKKLTERYTGELEGQRQHYDLLKEEKMDLEREYGERLQSMEVAHNSEMQKREGMYQSKIMEEVERFQQLQLETEMQKDRWLDKQQEMISAHENYMRSLTTEYEGKVEASRDARLEVEDECDGVGRDWDETRGQMEEDLDEEIERLKARYEEKLAAEREATLKNKGENGIMQKKFAALSKDIDEQREEIKAMLDKEQELRNQIGGLEKEIDDLKSTIHDRDVTIGDKEKKIYELKKRNQELEKFKFVLDYKIKELKRQIEPRENEIADMRKQIKEVDAELETYHRSNAKLDGLIGTLRGQLDDMQAKIVTSRSRLQKNQGKIDAFKGQLVEVSQLIQNPAGLRESFAAMYKAHVSEAILPPSSDASIEQEYKRQKEYLEKSIHALKNKLVVDTKKARNDNIHLMQQNMELVESIKKARKDAKDLRMQRKPPATKRRNRRGGGEGKGGAGALQEEAARLQELMNQQRDEIGVLRSEVYRLEDALQSARPISREQGGLH